MTDAVISPERFDLGRVLSRTFGVIGRNFPVFFGLSLLLAGAPTAAVGFGSFYYAGLMEAGSSDAYTGSAVLSIIGFVVQLLSSSILSAALVNSAVADLSGGRPSFGSSLATGIRFFLPLIALSILSGIAMLLGFALLVVPGVILAVIWSVTTPALVVDRRGVFGSFSRSRELTRGHRWIIFVLFLIYGAFWYALTLVLTVPGMMLWGAGGESGLLLYFMVWNPLQITILTMIGCAGVAALYVELRQIKEGVGAESIASVFA